MIKERHTSCINLIVTCQVTGLSSEGDGDHWNVAERSVFALKRIVK